MIEPTKKPCSGCGTVIRVINLVAKKPGTPGKVTAITDPAIWGPAKWAALHRRALRALEDDTRWIHTWLDSLPCPDCQAAAREWLAANPPQFGAAYFAWSVAFHNHANDHTGAARFDDEEARALWQRTL